MARRNRIRPDGEIVSTPQRGTLMGNRGCLHDRSGALVRNHALKRWIYCLLDFRGRRRPIMVPGRYTELFFLDEPTALAAGHRPCGECQRPRLKAFRDCWPDPSIRLEDLDSTLHRERLAPRREVDSPSSLPIGTMLYERASDRYLLCADGGLFEWTFDGYRRLGLAGLSRPFEVLTPPSTVATLGNGFEVALHPSAASA